MDVIIGQHIIDSIAATCMIAGRMYASTAATDKFIIAVEDNDSHAASFQSYINGIETDIQSLLALQIIVISNVGSQIILLGLRKVYFTISVAHLLYYIYKFDICSKCKFMYYIL